MNILVENETERVVHITDGTITLEADRAVAPDRIYAQLHSGNATVYQGVTPPTEDSGRYTYDGSTFTDTWPHKVMTGTEFILFLKSTASLTSTAIVAARDDTSAEMREFWLLFDNMRIGLSPDQPSTVGGFNALGAAGHLTTSQRDAALAAWPRERA